MIPLQIHCHGFPVTAGIEQHVTDKITKLQKFFSDITKVHVILKHEAMEYIAEAELHAIGNTNNLFAKAKSHDLYQAIDDLEKKLAIIVKKHHDKLKSL